LITIIAIFIHIFHGSVNDQILKNPRNASRITPSRRVKRGSYEECARLIDRARLAREGGPWLAFQDDQCLGRWLKRWEKPWENDGKRWTKIAMDKNSGFFE